MEEKYWQVFSNVIDGKTIYRVGRLLRSNEPLHSGNVEYVDCVLNDKQTAQVVADKLNSRGGAAFGCNSELQELLRTR
ncbi:MAG: hypothetical protein NC132_01510 [Corallococcus sp.]|nr:hypothetical protein [Corallococcus sp.]MCM1359335.1 hypothetical protein [Corallococcus sp.]MCM1394778.1 hypothetical protein [Corallococcus sp.]